MADGAGDESHSMRPTYQVEKTTTNFRGLNIKDNAQVHAGHIFGNVTNNYGVSEDEVAKIRQALVETEPKITDPETDRKNLMLSKGERVEGTCRWILEDESWQGWTRGDISVLSICGGPGKGKTMLADFIISELGMQAAMDDKMTLAYFFCVNEDARRNNTTSILRALLYQLVQARPSLTTFFAPHLLGPERYHAVLSSPDILWSILTAVADADHTGNFLCILDGLDECVEDTSWFFCRKLAERRGRSSLRFVLLSRPIYAFEAFTQIKLDPDNDPSVGRDIDLFIVEKIAKLSLKVRLDISFKQELHTALTNQAQGTFLWVGLAMEELFKQKTRLGVQKCMSELPVGLPSLYARMVCQIPEYCKFRCRIILLWAATAVRPMYVSAMAGVLDPGLRTVEESESISDVSDLIAECGSIVDVRAGQITLVHHSARDYLFRPEVDEPPELTYWRFDLAKANSDLLQTCVQCFEDAYGNAETNLTAFGVEHKSESSDEWEDEHAVDLRSEANYGESQSILDELIWNADEEDFKRTLCAYAAVCLGEHAKLVPESEQAVFEDQFFTNLTSPARTDWAYYMTGLADQATHHDNPLWHAFLTECWPWFRYLLSNMDRLPILRQVVEAKVGVGTPQTLLMSAAYRGNDDIIHLLLKHGADINVRDQDGDGCLAICRDRETSVRLLLEHGAEVDARNMFGETALHRTRDFGVLDCLIQYGADVNAPDRRGEVPLWHAVKDGNIELAHRLLFAGAMPDIRTGIDGATMLHRAFLDSNIEMVRCLLRHGASPNILDGNGHTLLHWAVYSFVSNWPCWYLGSDELGGCFLEVIELALEYHADPNCLNNDDETPLYRAVMQRTGPLPDSGFGQTITHAPASPFEYPFKRGGILVTNWLSPLSLVAIADVWTQICCNVVFGKLEAMIELFVAHGADMNFEVKRGWTFAMWYQNTKQRAERHFREVYRAYRYLQLDPGIRPVESNACSGCEQGSGFTRHICLQCRDLKVCTDCLCQTFEAHSGHELQTLNQEGQLFEEAEGLWPYFCEGCKKQIRRIIYKDKRRTDIGYCGDCFQDADLVYLHTTFERFDIYEEAAKFTAPTCTKNAPDDISEIYGTVEYSLE